jgi:hypothetical protein
VRGMLDGSIHKHVKRGSDAPKLQNSEKVRRAAGQKIFYFRKRGRAHRRFEKSCKYHTLPLPSVFHTKPKFNLVLLFVPLKEPLFILCRFFFSGSGFGEGLCLEVAIRLKIEPPNAPLSFPSKIQARVGCRYPPSKP